MCSMAGLSSSVMPRVRNNMKMSPSPSLSRFILWLPLKCTPTTRFVHILLYSRPQCTTKLRGVASECMVDYLGQIQTPILHQTLHRLREKHVWKDRKYMFPASLGWTHNNVSKYCSPTEWDLNKLKSLSQLQDPYACQEKCSQQ